MRAAPCPRRHELSRAEPFVGQRELGRRRSTAEFAGQWASGPPVVSATIGEVARGNRDEPVLVPSALPAGEPEQPVQQVAGEPPDQVARRPRRPGRRSRTGGGRAPGWRRRAGRPRGRRRPRPPPAGSAGPTGLRRCHQPTTAVTSKPLTSTWAAGRQPSTWIPAGSTPVSSCASRSAVAARSASPGSAAPPGKAI